MEPQKNTYIKSLEDTVDKYKRMSEERRTSTNYEINSSANYGRRADIRNRLVHR